MLAIERRLPGSNATSHEYNRTKVAPDAALHGGNHRHTDNAPSTTGTAPADEHGVHLTIGSAGNDQSHDLNLPFPLVNRSQSDGMPRVRHRRKLPGNRHLLHNGP